jgi:hypothetical protein
MAKTIFSNNEVSCRPIISFFIVSPRQVTKQQNKQTKGEIKERDRETKNQSKIESEVAKHANAASPSSLNALPKKDIDEKLKIKINEKCGN